MKKNFLLLAVLGVFTLTSCDKKADNATTDNQSTAVEDNNEVIEDTNLTEENTNAKALNLTLSPASGSNLSGTAEFKQVSDSVTMVVNISGVTPGTHAIHIHEKGDCSSPDAKSAGGHWNPAGSEHGKFDVESFHMGDIGNLEADKNGNATLTFTTDKWCIGCDDELKNIVGRSIIIHESEDDFTTQPTGNAGGRIGCVVIE